jgi:hypothetical protein
MPMVRCDKYSRSGNPAEQLLAASDEIKAVAIAVGAWG